MTLNLAVWHPIHGLNLTLPPPPTPTSVPPSISKADGSPATVDDYLVFKLEVSGAAIWLVHNKSHWLRLRPFDGIDMPLAWALSEDPRYPLGRWWNMKLFSTIMPNGTGGSVRSSNGNGWARSGAARTSYWRTYTGPVGLVMRARRSWPSDCCLDLGRNGRRVWTSQTSLIGGQVWKACKPDRRTSLVTRWQGNKLTRSQLINSIGWLISPSWTTAATGNSEAETWWPTGP